MFYNVNIGKILTYVHATVPASVLNDVLGNANFVCVKTLNRYGDNNVHPC